MHFVRGWLANRQSRPGERRSGGEKIKMVQWHDRAAAILQQINSFAQGRVATKLELTGRFHYSVIVAGS